MPLTRLTTQKIRPDHLDRQALIYIRQSTMLQVREHTGSAARQYDLVPRALDLGWPRERIRVLDQDQGQSGTSAATRDGFQMLVAEAAMKIDTAGLHAYRAANDLDRAADAGRAGFRP